MDIASAEWIDYEILDIDIAFQIILLYVPTWTLLSEL